MTHTRALKSFILHGSSELDSSDTGGDLHLKEEMLVALLG